MNSSAPVGLVGVGQLGRCFLERLRAHGLDVNVYDIDPAALARAREAGAVVCSTPAEAARGCETVLICVTGPDQVRECVLGAEGLQEGSAPGSLVIDTSTSLPATSREIGRSLADRGVDFIDAPVSRGIPAARAGSLSIMVGAERTQTAERARPILELLGSDIVTVGGTGDGHAVKLLNMMMMAAHLVAAAEALGIASCFGSDPESTVAAIESSNAASYMSSNHLPRYALSHSYASGFSLPLMLKDLGLMRKLADAVAVPVPLADRVWHTYSAARHHLGDVDNMHLVPFVAALAAGADPRRARADGLSGDLPHGARPLTEGPSLDDVCNMLGQSNAVAAEEASRVAKASHLSLHPTFSVIDMSSGASRFTGQLARGQFAPPTATADPSPLTPTLHQHWAPVLQWTATLKDAATRWSFPTPTEAAGSLLDLPVASA